MENEIGKGEAQSFAYTGFDRYTENSSTTKKINNAGFTLNLGLFSLGAHKTMTEVFTTSKVEESKRIFGELNIQIRDASYYMQTSSNIIKKIKLDYLTEDFKEELYNLTPSEFSTTMVVLFYQVSSLEDVPQHFIPESIETMNLPKRKKRI